MHYHLVQVSTSAGMGIGNSGVHAIDNLEYLNATFVFNFVAAAVSMLSGVKERGHQKIAVPELLRDAFCGSSG